LTSITCRGSIRLNPSPVKILQTPNAPAPAGHYSQAIVHDGLVYVSGQLPIEPGTNRHVTDSIESQTDQALRNVSAIVLAAGSSLDQVIRCTVYVSDVALWPRVNATYAKVFGNHRPARTVVPCGTLHHGFQVEIDAIAAVPRPEL
jgi:2-iminobutanoate/2-iminopropanoate deaminase